LRKKVIQIFLIVCLVLTVAVGGCARSETPAPSLNPNQPEEVTPEPIVDEEPISPPVVDSDGDGFNDWFETNIAHYDPNIPNDRYVIVFECWEEGLDNNGADRAWQFFREVAGVPSKNIITLKQKEATPFNLKKAIEEVAAKADENDIVCLDINAHGGGPAIGGWHEDLGRPGAGIKYSDIDQWLDEIKAKVIIISCCACGFSKNGVPVLKDGCCPRIIPRGPSYYCVLDPGFVNFLEADETGNKDGYVSMEEVKNYANYIFYKDDPDYRDYHEWMIDTSNIAPEIYLTDSLNVGNP